MDDTKKERNKLLARIDDLLDVPMVFLGFIWLILLTVELVYGLSPILEKVGFVIWGLFIVEFAIKFFLAPSKTKFLRSNILTLVSLLVPAFRVLRWIRLLRILRLSRSLRLVKVLGSINRAMKALSLTMKRRAFGYIILLTFIVIFAGAAGMFAFEKHISGGLPNYGTALWWTVMIITTLGSDYWPQTIEGRFLCVLLSLYAFAVFGYITATIATFFIGRDAESKRRDIADGKQIDELRKEIISIKQLLIEMAKR
jgi:voltage-gated potassium channel